MSTVMRPTGPLPPRVYWIRRLVLLVVIVLLATFVWWFTGGSGSADESDPTASAGTPTSTAPTTPSGSQPTTTTKPRQHHPTTPDTSATTDPPRSTQQPRQTEPSKQTKPTRTPLAQPTGDCRPSGVDITIDIGDSAPGRPNTATFLLSSTKTPACTLSITPDTMVVRVTSGDDVVWSSDDCPDSLRARQLVAREDPPTAYQFRWSGQRSSENCQPVDTAPKPGGYWVEAAMIGGEPHRAYFDIKPSAKG